MTREGAVALPPVLDQEFIVHLFAPLDGPLAKSARQQLRALWSACGQRLGLTDRVGSLPGPELPFRFTASSDLADIVAVRVSPSWDRQAVLRRVHDVLNLSFAFGQPAPEGRRPPTTPGSRARRRLGWAEFATLWDQTNTVVGNVLLGEVHLLLARLPLGVTVPVEAEAELGQALDPLLPYREDRPTDWWRWGATSSAGYVLWDTRLTADAGGVREIVIVANAGRDRELSTWAYSDGRPDIPPFARYLLHASKLRYQVSVLDSWHRSRAPDDVDQAVAELGAAVAPDAASPQAADLLRSLQERLSADERRLVGLEADLDRLHRTASIAQANMEAAAGRDAQLGSVFAADLALARWLIEQASDDLSYTRIELNRTSQMRALASEELDRAGRAHAVSPGPTVTSRSQVTRRVFMVHGRDTALVKRFYELLRAVHLEPLEWEKLVAGTGSAVPYLGQVVAKAPHLAQATLVLLSPDDIVELHPDLHHANDHPYERARAAQARPNVLFELGLALMAYPDRTVIVEVGQLRPIADLAGLNVIRFDGSAIAIKKVIDRLKLADCPVDTSGTDWLDPDRFADLTAYRRSPDTPQFSANRLADE